MATSRVEPQYPNAKSATAFQDGLEYQDFVCVQLAKEGIILQNLSSKKYQYEVGENLQGFEIKLDEPCTRTERLSIEVAEKSRDDEHLSWTASGICRNDNSWLYIQGNYEFIFVFPKNLLLRWKEQKQPRIDTKFGTIQTFYLSFSDARRVAAKVIEMRDR